MSAWVRCSSAYFNYYYSKRSGFGNVCISITPIIMFPKALAILLFALALASVRFSTRCHHVISLGCLQFSFTIILWHISPLDLVKCGQISVHCPTGGCLLNSGKCTLLSLQRRVYTVHSTIYSVQCTVYIGQFTVYILQCILYSLQFSMYSLECKYSVNCTIYTVQYTV